MPKSIKVAIRPIYESFHVKSEPVNLVGRWLKHHGELTEELAEMYPDERLEYVVNAILLEWSIKNR